MIMYGIVVLLTHVMCASANVIFCFIHCHRTNAPVSIPYERLKRLWLSFASYPWPPPAAVSLWPIFVFIFPSTTLPA